jgi:hypothetical protein
VTSGEREKFESTFKNEARTNFLPQADMLCRGYNVIAQRCDWTKWQFFKVPISGQQVHGNEVNRDI